MGGRRRPSRAPPGTPTALRRAPPPDPGPRGQGAGGTGGRRARLLGSPARCTLRDGAAPAGHRRLPTARALLRGAPGSIPGSRSPWAGAGRRLERAVRSYLPCLLEEIARRADPQVALPPLSVGKAGLSLGLPAAQPSSPSSHLAVPGGGRRRMGGGDHPLGLPSQSQEGARERFPLGVHRDSPAALRCPSRPVMSCPEAERSLSSCFRTTSQSLDTGGW